jgi:hypothetical protein
MWNRRHRWLRRFAAGLAFAGLVVVPTAQAHHLQISGGGSGDVAVRPDDRAVRISPQAVDSTSVVRPDDRAVRISPQPVSAADVVRPDDRAVRISPQPVDSTNVVRPDDRGVRFTPSGGELPQVVAAPSTGFDWGDAGIGAGTALGLMLLALGAALATRLANRKALAGA